MSLTNQNSSWKCNVSFKKDQSFHIVGAKARSATGRDSGSGGVGSQHTLRTSPWWWTDALLFVFVFRHTIRPNTNRLFRPLFGTEANTKRIFGTALVLSLYLIRKSSDFNEIWYADADYDSKVGYLTKYQNFSNSKWRTDRFSRFDTISAVTDTQPPRHVAVASTRYYAYLRRAVKMQLACVFLCGWSKMVEPRVTKFGDMLTLRRSVVRLILDSKGQRLRSDNLKVSACLTMPVASPNFISIHKMASSYAVDCYS